MRDLVILRGCPGSGKSTWIKDQGLEQYTLSPDNIRMMTRGLVLTSETNYFSITQEYKNESYVWDLLFELLERRMQNGDFTIIDATHSKSSDFSKYNKLCEKYKYRKYVVSFTDVPIEVCKQRNKEREDYKKVPESVIDKMYARFQSQDKTSGWVNIPRQEFSDYFKTKPIDIREKYEKVFVIGDIHGCYNPLREFILNTTKQSLIDKNATPDELPLYLEDNYLYIFLGDYIDRGLQNKEVLQFLINIKDKQNVWLLEGNHEKYIGAYINNDFDKCSKEFLKNTMNQIKDLDTKKLSQLYRKFSQMAYIKYKNGTNYFMCHGGLNIIPNNIHLVSTQQLIKGVGDYNTPIDEIYSKNIEKGIINNSPIQIHGHRSIEQESKFSISLEDGIERGGNLDVVDLDDISNIIKYKNDLYRTDLDRTDLDTKPKIYNNLNEDNLVERLRLNTNIQEKDLGNNISSFNFTRNAFCKGIWDNETIKARGLFINTKNNKIVARGYEKFFNINEKEETRLFNLKSLFETNNPVIGYKKYNGFLGLLSYYNDDLQFHSKSSNNSEFVTYFKNIFYKQYSTDQIEKIIDYLKNNDVTMVFEVIDIENDPHIIKETNDRIVLLDIIYNKLEFKKLAYKDLVNVASKLFNLNDKEYKQIYKIFNSYRDLIDFYNLHTDENNFQDTDIEGIVIESGNFMTKLKFNYYRFWKQMRILKEQVISNKQVKLSRLYNKEANDFYSFLKDYINKIQLDLKDIKDKSNISDLDLKHINKYDIEENSIIYRDKDINSSTKYVVDNDTIELFKNIKNIKFDIISLRDEFHKMGYSKDENKE